MHLFTPRLELRPFREDDGEGLYAYLSDSETVFFEPYGPFTQEQAARAAKIRSEDDRYIAVCLKDGQLIGNLYLDRQKDDVWEIGYVLSRAFWGMGYAFEAASAAMARAFQNLGAKRIFAETADQNARSCNLARRLGMEMIDFRPRAVCFKKDENANAIWWDVCVFSVNAQNFGQKI